METNQKDKQKRSIWTAVLVILLVANNYKKAKDGKGLADIFRRTVVKNELSGMKNELQQIKEALLTEGTEPVTEGTVPVEDSGSDIEQAVSDAIVSDAEKPGPVPEPQAT